jgi:hypothetical protein
MVDRKTIFIRGKAQYAKILDPVSNYNRDGYEWTLDLQLDEAGVAQAKAELAPKKIKTSDAFGKYVRFKQGTTYTDKITGETKQRSAPPIVDATGKPWDMTKKIGNGSLIDVKASVVDYGAGKELGVYLSKVRILDHIPYEGAGGDEDFPELEGEDKAFAEAVDGEDFPAYEAEMPADDIDIDDDIPF